MADFIIQPKNDDHLKLNNDAGTTILELANDESKLRLASNNISASDGTTAITTSSANVTLAGTANNIGTVTSGTFNSTIGTSATFPAGHLLKVSIVNLASDVDHTGDTAYQDIFNTADFTPNGGSSNNSTIYPFFDWWGMLSNNTTSDARQMLKVTYGGAAHSPTVSGKEYNIGAYLNYANPAERELFHCETLPLPPVTISASGTFTLKLEMRNVASQGRIIVYGDNSGLESRIRFMEVQ